MEDFNFLKFMNVYEFDTELLGTGEKLKFKPMTTGQAKELIPFQDETDPIKAEEILDKVIKDCIIKPENFDVDSMYLEDKAFFLYELRRRTKGDFYEFKYTCPNCKSQSKQKIDIKTFPRKKLDIKNDLVKLNDKISLRMKFLTRKDQKEIIEIVQGMFKEKEDLLEANEELNDDEKDKQAMILEFQKMTETGFLSHAYSIKSILSPDSKNKKNLVEENEVPLTIKRQLLESLPEVEYKNIKKFFDDNEFGIEFKFEIICPHCQNKEEKELPVENFFL